MHVTSGSAKAPPASVEHPRPSSKHAARSSSRAHLVAVAHALPDHRVLQPDARALAARVFGERLGGVAQRLLSVFDNSGIETRRACMPLEWYETPRTFGETNARYVEHALLLAGRAGHAALERAGVTPAEVTHLMFVSSTGIATPTIDARLAARDGFAPDVRRVPVWGLGCAGGAAGMARAADFARSDPDAVVLLIAVELCSLAFQPREIDPRNVVATALFSDGAAAAVLRGGSARAHAPVTGGRGSSGDLSLEVVDSASTLWPDTLDIMGWTVDGNGLHVVFSRDIPVFIRTHIHDDIAAFLARSGRTIQDVDHFAAHPGGPRVLEAWAETLAVAPERFVHARDVLREHGNMSSPTCLFVLERLLGRGEIRPGETVLLAALGPGFASEYVLLRAR